MRAGYRCPNFAFMTPKFGAKKVVQYQPIWLRKPDCGPLNMKLDTCHHLNNILYYYSYSYYDSLSVMVECRVTLHQSFIFVRCHHGRSRSRRSAFGRRTSYRRSLSSRMPLVRCVKTLATVISFFEPMSLLCHVNVVKVVSQQRTEPQLRICLSEVARTLR